MTHLSTSRFRADIQGLRAIAILLVVLGHAGIPGFSGGFIGVDVFLVLSGYLISGLLLQEWRTTGHIHIAGFLSRRLRRLLPALLVMLVATLVVASQLLSPLEVRAQSRSLVYAVTWTSNFHFALDTVDYFAELEARDLFLHTWSLGVEEQFYLLWPPLLLLLLRGGDGDLWRNRRLRVGLGILAVGSLGLCWYWSAIQPMWAFYLMPARIWQFSLGAGVFLWQQAHPTDSHRNDMALLGLGLILGSGLLLHPLLTYPGYWALFPSLGTAALLLASGNGEVRGITGWLAHPLLVWLGDRSYSWYLWHWPVLLMGGALELTGGVDTLALVGLSLLLATVSYHWVELPFWRGRLGDTTPQRINLTAVLAILALIAVAPHLRPPLPPPGPVSPLMTAAGDLPVIYSLGCDTWYEDAAVKPCVIGDDHAPSTVVLLGDSIGVQWFSLVPGIFQAPDWRIVVFTKSSCPMVDEDFFYQRIGSIYTVCNEWRDGVLAQLEQLQPDLVIIGSAATYDFSEQQWIEGSSRILARLSQAAGQVILVPGTPTLPFNGPGCLMRGADSIEAGASAACQGEAEPRFAQVSALLAEAVQRFPNANLLNLNEQVCPENRCMARNADGVVVFRDSQHLTDTFVRRQIPWVRRQLQALGVHGIPAS